MNYTKNNKRGFTMIETLIAISILLLAATGPLALSRQSLSAAYNAKDEIIAFHLAQEAVEAIKNKRDTNSLRQTYWLADLDKCISPNKCSIDAIILDLVTEDCTTGCKAIKFDDNREIYSSFSGNATKFTRTATIEEIEPNVEAVVTVEVSWPAVNRTRSQKIVDNMYNWQQ